MHGVSINPPYQFKIKDFDTTKMLKMSGILACLLIVALDITAGILGIEAEAAQNKEKQMKLLLFECRDPSRDAFKLGLAAAILLSLAHVATNLFGGCMCICSQEELQKASNNKKLSMTCFVLTWIILAIGLSLLVSGTISNNKSRASCGFTHQHVLSIGGVMCILHGLCSVGYYVTATATLREELQTARPHP